MITEGYHFVKAPTPSSAAIRILTADETKDCIVRSGGGSDGYHLFVAILRAEDPPVTTYLQINPLGNNGVTLRGYGPLLTPKAHEWRRNARKRLNLPL